MVQAYNDWLPEYAAYDLRALRRRCRSCPTAAWSTRSPRSSGWRSTLGIRGFVMGALPERHAAACSPRTTRCSPRWPSGAHAQHPRVADDSRCRRLNALALPRLRPLLGATDHLIDLIFSGVFDRFPELNVVFAEVDCGWVPYFKEQIDNSFYRYRFRFDLKKLPSEYVEQHVHFTWVTDTYGIDNRHQIGVDKMLWSSDYPHGNSNYPERVVGRPKRRWPACRCPRSNSCSWTTPSVSTASNP